MSKNLLSQDDSATTEKVVSNAQSDLQLLLEQNRKALELLEKQQVPNSLLMQRLCQQETPQSFIDENWKEKKTSCFYIFNSETKKMTMFFTRYW